MKRTGDSVLVGCEATDETWRLRCHKNSWIGSYANCSRGLYIINAILLPIGNSMNIFQSMTEITYSLPLIFFSDRQITRNVNHGEICLHKANGRIRQETNLYN